MYAQTYGHVESLPSLWSVAGRGGLAGREGNVDGTAVHQHIVLPGSAAHL